MTEERRATFRQIQPPNQRSTPAPFVRMPSEQPTVGQSTVESLMLDTWYGQIITRGITNKMAGVPNTPMHRFMDTDYNVYRDEDLSDMWPYLDELQDVRSHEEFVSRKYQIQVNQDLRHSLEDYGVNRFLAAGIIDPINLIPVPLVLGKGFLAGAKRAAAINAPLVAGTEALRVDLDPTAEPVEVLYSTVGSMMFAGVIGGLAGQYKPIGKMTVSDALDVLVPLDKPVRAEAGMFNWIRFVGRGAFRRIHDQLRSTDNAGGFKSSAHADRVTLKDADGEVFMYVDGKNVGFAMTRGGDTLQVSTIEIPEAMRGQGVGTAVYKSLIKYAQDNGLKVVSDTQTSKSAARVWRSLKREGYNIELNKTSKVEDALDGEKVLMSGDGQPNFRVLSQLEDQKAKIPESLKEDFADYTLAVRETSKKISRVKDRLKNLRAQLKGMENNNGGRRTKQKERIKEAQSDLQFLEGEKRIMQGRLDDTNTKMSLLLDEEVAKNWDLLPTGYNKILANTDQFPFWQLMKSPVSEALPDVGRRMQMYALRMASTPGINTEGHVLGHSAGRSVESSAPVHYAGFVNAKRESQRLYAKYIGLGETTGGFTHYTVDQGQRVRGFFNKARNKAGLDEVEMAPEGKLSMQEFDAEITLAILQKGEHSIPEVAQAANHYIKWIREIGEAAKKEGIFATQKNLARQLEKSKARLKELDRRVWHTLDEEGNIKPTRENSSSISDPLRIELELEIMNLEAKLDAYTKADAFELEGEGWIHRLWRKDDVVAKEVELKEYLTKEFTKNPHKGKVTFRIDDEAITVNLDDPDAIAARVDEAYSAILREAEHGGDGEFVVTSTDQRDWLLKRKAVLEEQLKETKSKQTAIRISVIEDKLKRIENGHSTMGGASVLIGRKLDLDDTVLHGMGVIEQNVTTWASHYATRMAPLIETSRIFGDSRAQLEIDQIYSSIKRGAREARKAGDNKKAEMLEKEAERTLTATQDLRDIVQGIYGIPDNPEAMTGRILRLLRNLNLISAMGRSTLMAFGDTGNVVVSQGFTNTFRQLVRHFRRGLTDGSIKMMEDEVELAGSAVEVIMAQRFRQLTELGGSAPRTGSAFNRLEIAAQNMSQRFFLHNMMAPWTDMMRRVSGSMLQSKIIQNAHAFRDGTIKAEDIKVMARLGINKDTALRMLKEWEAAGSLKHDNMFVANTEQWASEELKLTFRSALNTEINRMVPTPGAADKPKGLLKSEWWKVVGQYRGFTIGATHRIMSAGLQTQSASKYAGIASMITIAMMVDAWKRPDYIKLPIEEAVLRAVELSGVTGIILDLNDSIERASAGGFGLRPAMGMDIRERDPNWANRLGTVGAVPNQLLTLLHAFGSDDATVANKTRAIRYMMPYNNLIWWNEYVNRMQRSTTEFLED